MNPIYKCPVCAMELIKTDNAFACGRKHSFDISSRGYVNLLLANRKKTREPGDSKAMIENREYFLNQGYYDPLSDKVNEIMEGCLHGSRSGEGDKKRNILDLGCGEGFYSAKLRESLRAEHRDQTVLWGIDISKAAIQKAAKRDKNVRFCIGSNFQLPYLDESFDGIFSIFSPFDSGEVKRVLKPGGHLVVVRPGPGHLQELAALIYDTVKPQGNSSDMAANLDLKPVQTLEVKYQIHLKNSRDIESLIGMTPYVWSLHEEKKQLLAQREELSVTADFQVALYQK